MADPENAFGINLGEVRDRLATLDYFTSVQDIQAAAQAIDATAPFIPPAAFVSIGRETYEPNRYAAGGHAQRATVTLSVLFCVPATRADGATSDEVEQARKAIRLILMGWKPGGADKALEAGSYSVRLIADGLIWGEWLFATSFDTSAAE